MKDTAQGIPMTFEEWWDAQESFKKFAGGISLVILKHRIAEEAWRAALSTCEKPPAALR